jgi:ribonuclease HI
MAKQKFYVVWKGRKTGVFSTWAECEAQVKGFTGAEYKAFESRAEAKSAFAARYDDFKGKPASMGKWKHASIQPKLPSICVDAACDGSPGKVEYRGVLTETG